MIISEYVPGVRSASVGVWVRWGASHEPPDLMGAAHLIEHMVFKGTGNRSGRQIALEIEGIGGSLDAYTTREHTAYYVRVLDEDLPVAVNVLADLVGNPLFREDDLALEKQVILEEIAGVEDSPEELVFELHARALWGDHPYGNPVLGTAETVEATGSGDLRRMWATHYRPENMVVAAAGNLEHEDLVDLVGRQLVADGRSGEPAQVPPPMNPAPVELLQARDSAQSHICLGCSLFAHNDPRRYAAILVSLALGGGMSSRLFQRVREELGLAYAIYSYQSFYQRAGLAGVYLATRPDMAERATMEVRDELAGISASGLPADELEAARNQAKGHAVLSLESTSARLHRLAGVEIYQEPYRTLDELCGLIDSVSVQDVAEVCETYYAPDRQTAVRLGPNPGNEGALEAAGT